MLGEKNTFSALVILNDFKVATIENNGNLSNGDKVKIKINYSDSVVEEAGIEVQNAEWELEVSGLGEKEKIDIFEEVELSVSPSKGDKSKCMVSAYHKGEKHYFGWTSSAFVVTDTEGNRKDFFAEGETVIVSLTQYGIDVFNGSLQSRNYDIEKTSAEFTVTVNE